MISGTLLYKITQTRKYNMFTIVQERKYNWNVGEVRQRTSS